LAKFSSYTTVSRKSFGILANERPRSRMLERGDRFSADARGQKRTR
jgi:hypothetical protein